MKSYQGWLLSGVLLALVIQFRLAELTKAVEDKIRDELKKFIPASATENEKKELEKNIRLIIYTLQNSKGMKNYKSKSYLGLRSSGVLVELENSSKETFLAKVVIDADKKYQICNIEKVIQELNSKRVSYVNVFKEFINYNGTDNTSNFYSCIVVTERPDQDLDHTQLFFRDDSKSIVENSKKMFRFFGRVAQSFAEMHFRTNVLHGGINPETIMVNIKKVSEGVFDLVPVITDFSLRLLNPEKKDLPDEQLRYMQGYRPPEMLSVMMRGKEALESLWYANWKTYKFSEEFTEDVYALGKTIRQLLIIHFSFLSFGECQDLELENIYTQMMKVKEVDDPQSNTTKKRIRPNMKEVLGMFINAMKKCYKDDIDPLDQEFLTQAQESLAELQKNILIV